MKGKFSSSISAPGWRPFRSSQSRWGFRRFQSLTGLVFHGYLWLLMVIDGFSWFFILLHPPEALQKWPRQGEPLPFAARASAFVYVSASSISSFGHWTKCIEHLHTSHESHPRQNKASPVYGPKYLPESPNHGFRIFPRSVSYDLGEGITSLPPSKIWELPSAGSSTWTTVAVKHLHHGGKRCDAWWCRNDLPGNPTRGRQGLHSNVSNFCGRFQMFHMSRSPQGGFIGS